jgi:hypothetical protein
MKISKMSQELIKGLLRYDPAERLSVEEVLICLLSEMPENKLIKILDGYPIETKPLTDQIEVLKNKID